MNPQNDNFYISPELSKVVDLVFKRQEMIALITDTDEVLEEFYHITNKLEKLVVKEPKNEKTMEYSK